RAVTAWSTVRYSDRSGSAAPRFQPNTTTAARPRQRRCDRVTGSTPLVSRLRDQDKPPAGPGHERPRGSPSPAPGTGLNPPTGTRFRRAAAVRTSRRRRDGLFGLIVKGSTVRILLGNGDGWSILTVANVGPNNVSVWLTGVVCDA